MSLDSREWNRKGTVSKHESLRLHLPNCSSMYSKPFLIYPFDHAMIPLSLCYLERG